MPQNVTRRTIQQGTAKRGKIEMGQLIVDLSSRISDLQPTTKKALRSTERKGVSFPKYFTQKLEAGKTPYDEIAWELRTATIGNDKGAIIFEQHDVEVPADWSQTATNIVASKYFHGRMGSPERERSVRQLVHRVVDTIADWGAYGRYFKTREDAENFRDELAHLMLTRRPASIRRSGSTSACKEARGYGFYYDEATDSIVKLKKGESRPQCSACFINSVEGFARIHSRSRQDRRHAVQVGLGHRHQPLAPARRRRRTLGRRPRLRPAQLHEGLRRFRRRHQIRRQNAPRREDGDPQRRSPRHRKIRLVQGQGREEGAHADRCRLRFLARWRSLRLHLLPERQQLRARHRRVHGSGGSGRRLVDPLAWPTASP